MKTHETYVSLETAKLLKQAGFDWEVNHSYPNCDSLDNSCSGYMEDLPFYHNLNDGKYGGMSAPTLDVAQKWLREVKDTYVIPQIRYYEADGRIREYDYRVGIHNVNPIRGLYKYKSYEESLESGIQNCLTLILEKGE